MKSIIMKDIPFYFVSIRPLEISNVLYISKRFGRNEELVYDIALGIAGWDNGTKSSPDFQRDRTNRAEFIDEPLTSVILKLSLAIVVWGNAR